MKKCTTCGAIKPKETDFYFDTCTDTYGSKCKVCTSRYNSMYRQHRAKGIKFTVKDFRKVLQESK